MPDTKRNVFFLSDRTGITAETLGLSLLTQFDSIEFHHTILPFIDTCDKARHAVQKINRAAQQTTCQPLLFSTIINEKIRQIIATSNGVLFDLFATFISPLENELNRPSSTLVGRAHGRGQESHYKERIDAVNFALHNDDGASTHDYPAADVILLGVSRTGKTPTCLYLALQYGIKAANYPLTEEDMNSRHLPTLLAPYQNKLFALTINPLRLHEIREERLPNSRYASQAQCEHEVQSAENIFRHQRVAFLDTSSASIEEIATTLLQQCGLQRRLLG
ncbi:MAG: kinase/pyrophosphorylase [Gammaproteobacteria bacterium]|nr:kinase/pyrophosphorylase [Gammaproteobacteria bacterium]